MATKKTSRLRNSSDLRWLLFIILGLFGGFLIWGVTPSEKNEMPQGNDYSNLATVSHDGITMTVMPSEGTTGTLVTLSIEGLQKNRNLSFATIAFKDSQGNYANESITIDRGSLNKEGAYTTSFRIPQKVVIWNVPVQNPSSTTPIATGVGMFELNRDGSVEKTLSVPFLVK